MKNFVSITAIGFTLFTNTALAKEYTCLNILKNVDLTVKLLTSTAAEIEVRSPFQKQMSCNVVEFTNGTDKVKGLACDNEDEIPDILVINEKTLKGMIEVIGQPHYDLDCKHSPEISPVLQ